MDKYIVIEMQTFADGAMSTPCYAYDSQASAEAKYHSILAGAAVSELPVHAAVLANNAGVIMESKCYYHQEVGE